MASPAGKYKIDMCHGPLFKQIILFSVPLFLSGVLQFLFHAADLAVVGSFGSANALAAVGASGIITSLFINTFMGLAIGANVVIARYFGSQNQLMRNRAIHTTIALSIAGGLLLGTLCIILAETMLRWTNVPEVLIPQAKRYLMIFCSGIPFLIFFNFGSAILRSAGDTKRPLYYLITAGIINVVLNLIFVICFHWDVAGVAWATIISKFVACIFLVRNLLTNKDGCKVKLSLIKFHPALLKEILIIGVPAGLQSACFSLSNLTIQSTINTFGPAAIAGNTAAITLEVIINLFSYSYHMTAISFVGQNVGGQKPFRMMKSIIYCIGCAIFLDIVGGFSFILFSEPLMRVFNSDPAVIAFGVMRMKHILCLYFLCGLMDVLGGCMRGLGYSTTSAIVTFMGVCVLRIAWVFFVFPLDPTPENLFLSYPITWCITSLINGTLLILIIRKIFRNHPLDLYKLQKSVRARLFRRHLETGETGV